MKYLTLSFLFVLVSHLITAQDVPSMAPPVIKERIVKVQFFSPLTGDLAFGYEQVFLRSVTLTGELGIIGASAIHLKDHEKGMFVKAGAKFYFAPDYVLDGMKRYNDFQGFYFNPILVYSGFGFDYTTNAGITDRGSNNSFGLLLHLGKQWVISNILALDIYGGIGYGFSSIKADNYNSSSGGYYADLSDVEPYKFSHIQPDNNVPVAFDAGFSIGILLK